MSAPRFIACELRADWPGAALARVGRTCEPALWRTADPKAIGRALYHRLTIIPAGSEEQLAIAEEVYRALKEAAPGALRRLVEDDEEAAKQEKRRARIVDGHEFGGGDAPWEHR